MLVSVRWLNSMLDSGLDVEGLMDLMNRAGLEVDGYTELGMGSGKIVVARVAEFTKHPNADKLSLVKADVGAGATANIVCGATNLYDGMLVPCALPGALLPGGVKIKRGKIRGEASEGMLCSARELGFGADHSGIMDLPDSFAPGEPFEGIIDIDITPNRSDCLSIYGVARDLAAMLGKEARAPEPKLEETLGPVGNVIKLSVPAAVACPRYTCRYLKGVKIGPSPLWMRRTLESVGLRSINNVVDVTNYVMFELGQPLHAFDYATIRGGEIIVRMAEEGEAFTSLDDTELKLEADDLVIADAERAIALAGVMGGLNSEVSDATTELILECACFNPSSIRRTARRHGLPSESAYRFERGIDRGGLERAVDRAAQLIQELAGGEIAAGMLDVDQPDAPDRKVELELARANDLIGLELTAEDIERSLSALGFSVIENDGARMTIERPTFRNDVSLDVDLIEEVARVYGYDKVPTTMPAIASHTGESLEMIPSSFMRRVRTALTGLGLVEAVHYDWVNEETACRYGFDPEALVHMANPLTVDQTLMRPTVVPALLGAVATNQRHGGEGVAMFEIGRTFPPGARVGHEEDEGSSLVIALTGRKGAHWSGPAGDYDFFDLKGMIEELIVSLGLGEIETGELKQAVEVYHAGRSASIACRRTALGSLGELHPALAEAEGLRGRVQVAQIDIKALFELFAAARSRYKEFGRFPASQRDLAVVVDKAVEVGAMLAAARKAGRPALESVTVLDCYEGEHVAEGKKSIALRLTLRSAEGTLTEDEINAATEKVLKALAKQCGAELRS